MTLSGSAAVACHPRSPRSLATPRSATSYYRAPRSLDFGPIQTRQSGRQKAGRQARSGAAARYQLPRIVATLPTRCAYVRRAKSAHSWGFRRGILPTAVLCPQARQPTPSDTERHRAATRRERTRLRPSRNSLPDLYLALVGPGFSAPSAVPCGPAPSETHNRPRPNFAESARVGAVLPDFSGLVLENRAMP